MAESYKGGFGMESNGVRKVLHKSPVPSTYMLIKQKRPMAMLI